MIGQKYNKKGREGQISLLRGAWGARRGRGEEDFNLLLNPFLFSTL
jgi:hypothetical protein